MKRRLGAHIACAVLLMSGAARADKMTDAEELFRRAKGLMSEKKDREACPLLEESNRLDPQMGTLLNLAICHENVGKIASAWGEFRAVEQLAKNANREDRVKLAHDRAARLEPRLPRLRIVVADRSPGLVVKVDGEPKGEALWSGVAVDPGTRTVEASAPNKLAVTVKAKVDDEGVTVAVNVPKLEDAPKAPSPAESDAPGVRPEHYEANRAKKTTGLVVGASGLAVLAAGGVFGILAITTNHSAGTACPAPCVAGSGAAQTADDHTDHALLFANVANVAIPVGAIAAAIGGYLFFTAGPTTAPRTTAFAVAPGGGSFAFRW